VSEDQLVSLVAALGAVLLSAIVCLFVGLDLSYEWNGEEPLERRLTRWSDRLPFLSGSLVLVLGALLAHFFWKGFP
jgi:hypothetical protein